ncbi:uncharacterized protein EHS24_007847 [Apiotrichum porosum]|uniref:Cupin type-2 domain-containing protein n=1 Tax=Apiotrichum porosum TaxID=105984 RepID=A0A427XS42_9TREE|nr:uncharacterized protein EHS24_007847 [Apiotrichum porosum]RSH81666.1 hypothetical protein EHS24_007847 [Apiotrichum porosum]
MITNADGSSPGDKLVVSHAKDATYTQGLRSFFAYRDLGIKDATNGAVAAHVIRGVPGSHATGIAHLHRTTFQMVYVLKGWVEFEYEGQDGVVHLEPGDSVYQPPGIRHREVAHSDDVEMLEVVLPGDFGTEEVPGLA